jgi:integral membrane sensor domain MASE1
MNSESTQVVIAEIAIDRFFTVDFIVRMGNLSIMFTIMPPVLWRIQNEYTKQQ